MTYRYATRTDQDGTVVASIECPHGITSGRLRPDQAAGVEVLHRLVSRHVVTYPCECVARVGTDMARVAAGGPRR